MVHQLRMAGVVVPDGRIAQNPPAFADRLVQGDNGRRILLSSDGELSFTQTDVRELQKAKGAMRAAMDILMERLGLRPSDMQRVILTGSFGAQLDTEAVLAVGMLPPVRHEVVETIPNGAGLGAAMFLSDEGFAWSQELAGRVEQVDLDQDPHFMTQYVTALALEPGG
jgi:uncharacterized 2Fe-2S/4Fe-4S cluster protein (DUF4445 family)